MGENEEEITATFRAKPAATTDEKQLFLVALTGNSAGRSVRFEGAPCVLGRSADADFLLDDDGISRKHARIFLAVDGRICVKDLASTNGTFVNDERVDVQEIKSGDRIRLGANTTVRFAYEDPLETNIRVQLFSSATHDPLTGILNKRAFDEQALRAVAYSRRYQAPLSLVLLDVDHFKSVNDTHGHPVGDEVLKLLAQRVLTALRVEDIFCRVGGEEFALLLPGIDSDNGRLAADRVRMVIARDPFPTEAGDLDVSISAGVATYDAQKHAKVEQLVQEADTYLYEAKHNGRNCVRPEPPRRRKMFRDVKTLVEDRDIQAYAAAAKAPKEKL